MRRFCQLISLCGDGGSYSARPRLRWASVVVPVRVAKKKTGRVIVPVPVPRFSEAYPIPRR